MKYISHAFEENKKYDGNMLMTYKLCVQNSDKLAIEISDDDGKSLKCINPSICSRFIYFRGLFLTKTKWLSTIIMYDKKNSVLNKVPCNLPDIDNLEDLRLFDWKGKVYFIGYQRNKYHVFETFVGYFSDDGKSIANIEFSFKVPFVHVKNLVPLIYDNEMYIIDMYTSTVYRQNSKLCALVFEEPMLEQFCGSTQFLKLSGHDSLFGGIVHKTSECGAITSYKHYWIEIDVSDWRVKYVSLPFTITGDSKDFITGINLINGYDDRYQLMFGHMDTSTIRCEVSIDHLRNVKRKARVLYVSFNTDMWTNFDTIAQEHMWDVTHLYPPHGKQMTPEIAQSVWTDYYEPFMEQHKSTFSHIVVSDTIHCCLPFASYMKTNKEIIMILHLTNNFDYGYVRESKWIYNSINSITQLPNVNVVYVNQFIEKCISQHGFSGRYLPFSGKITTSPTRYNTKQWNDVELCSHTGTKINTSSKVCASDIIQLKLMSDDRIHILPKQYKSSELCNFDAILYLPNSYSTLSLHEMLSMGLIVIVPSYEFLVKMSNYNVSIKQQWCDAYNGPCASIITYFDNLDECNEILYKVHHDCMWVRDKRKQIQDYMMKYDKYIIDMWKSIIF